MIPGIRRLIELLKRLDPRQLQGVLEDLINELKSLWERIELLRLVKDFLCKYKWQIAFMVIGIVLILNPLAMVGFSASGPVAGSLAAAWQSSIGSVAGGSVFAVLQSLGMTVGPALFSISGGTVLGTAVVSGIMKRWGGALGRVFATARAMGMFLTMPSALWSPLGITGLPIWNRIVGWIAGANPQDSGGDNDNSGDDGGSDNDNASDDGDSDGDDDDDNGESGLSSVSRIRPPGDDDGYGIHGNGDDCDDGAYIYDGSDDSYDGSDDGYDGSDDGYDGNDNGDYHGDVYRGDGGGVLLKAR